MRELQLWSADDGLETTFAEITALAESCRFRDCAHAREPGCAVLAAVDDGTLALDRLRSWRKLQRELESIAARTDKRLAAARKKRWKQLATHTRHHSRR